MRDRGVTFRKPTEADIRFVADNMRTEDRRELKRWTAQEPEYELRHSIDCSEVCYAGVFADGTVACIFGACRANIIDASAVVWSLSTTAVGGNRVAFLAGSKIGLDRVFREMPDVEYFSNYVDLGYEAAVRWLEHLGFGKSLAPRRPGIRGGVFGLLYTMNPYYKED